MTTEELEQLSSELNKDYPNGLSSADWIEQLVFIEKVLMGGRPERHLAVDRAHPVCIGGSIPSPSTSFKKE